MFRDKRWFVMPCTLDYETLQRRMEGNIKLIRYYEFKYDRTKNHEKDDYKVVNTKDTKDVNELIYLCADYPFDSWRTDVIKERLWRLLDL